MLHLHLDGKFCLWLVIPYLRQGITSTGHFSFHLFLLAFMITMKDIHGRKENFEYINKTAPFFIQNRIEKRGVAFCWSY